MRFIRSELLDRDLSVLGFGAAAVLGRTGRRESLQALAAASDAGINFFDTARSYGYGESEALLGEFFAGRRHSVVISTKFGIVPSRQSTWKQMAKPLARAVVRALPGVRKNLRKHVAAQFQPGQFTVPILTKSVETSLKKLRTDYIDILLMHEASVAAIHDDDLLAAMQALRDSGKVRVIGASSEPEIVADAAANEHLKAIQFPSHVGNGFARVGAQRTTDASMLKIVNHPFGGADGSLKLWACLEHVASDTAVPASLRAKLLDHDGGLLADIALNIALGSDNDIVLATMMQPAHLQMNVAAVMKSRFDVSELQELRTVLARRNSSAGMLFGS
jgi:aryl-alcohol dehydrogenase-like predicted oxidoreductase